MSGKGVSCISQGCNNESTDKKKIDKKVVKIRFFVFFDGTRNNRSNTLARIANHSSYKGNEKGTSFANDESNIAKLEKLVDASKVNNSDFDFVYPIYIEGIGTENFSDDTFAGYAFGLGDTGVVGKVLGDTGVVGKVEKGSSFVQNMVKSTSIPEKKVEITIDCMGFSRGAAAARNFIYRILKDPKENLKLKLESSGYTVVKVKFEFVGLFDTVAHYGVMFGQDDTKDLNLDAISNATKVVQLVAADDYRYNFPLTNIASKSGGTEIRLPGAHSDIGGGYNNTSDSAEDKVVDSLSNYSDTLKNWFVDEGWAVESELSFNILGWLKLKRQGISNKYSNIPLLIMLEHCKSSGIKTTRDIEQNKNIVNKIPVLEQVYKLLTPLGNEAWKKKENKELIKKLRKSFCHFSADDTVNISGVSNFPKKNGKYYTREICNG